MLFAFHFSKNSYFEIKKKNIKEPKSIISIKLLVKLKDKKRDAFIESIFLLKSRAI